MHPEHAHREVLIDQLRSKASAAARAVAHVAAKGIPAVRAAVNGARIGAGQAFGPAIVEQLGFRVVPHTARAMAAGLARAPGEAAVILRRGRSLLKATARELILHGEDGATLRVSPRGGAVATMSHEAVTTVARSTARTALAGVGRAALGGAAAGAVLEAGWAGVHAVMALRRGEMQPRDAARHVGLYAVRGAVAGGVGVAAAGIVSAGMAASGLMVLGAPVAVPLATMLVVGAYASRRFDRRFGTR